MRKEQIELYYYNQKPNKLVKIRQKRVASQIAKQLKLRELSKKKKNYTKLSGAHVMEGKFLSGYPKQQILTIVLEN